MGVPRGAMMGFLGVPGGEVPMGLSGLNMVWGLLEESFLEFLTSSPLW